ncbi:hypothetical protein ACIPPS_11290 [Streptomyces sp. NPDC090127]|uniref:hypothetical protein n=1 Tax=Streptomyces sp. NPDC090127 TaxID=3365953 RepID=UPI0037F1E467
MNTLPPLAALAQVKGALRFFAMDAGRLAHRFRKRALVQVGVDVHIGVADTWASAATASAWTGDRCVVHQRRHRVRPRRP